MEKMILSFGIIIVGVIIGQVVKFLKNTKDEHTQKIWEIFIERSRKFTFFVLNPIVMINSYWIIDFSNISIFALPFICVAVLALSGGIGLLVSKGLKHNNEQKASMFAVSTFSNLGTIGGLITFSFFGETAFAIAAMFIFFESFYNYLIGYPLVKAIGENVKGTRVKAKDFLKDPSIVIYVSAVFVGLFFNMSGFERPHVMGVYNEYAIPTVSFLLISAIATKMDLGKTKTFIKEGVAVILIKYLFAPLVAILVALACGLQNLENGLVLKVVIIMTLVPCGFNSILVPTIYKADKDVANTAWVFSMIALAVVVPLEYLFFFMV